VAEDFQTVSEGEFSEVRGHGVLRSSADVLFNMGPRTS
jgi:hypothetical protein